MTFGNTDGALLFSTSSATQNKADYGEKVYSTAELDRCMSILLVFRAYVFRSKLRVQNGTGVKGSERHVVHVGTKAGNGSCTKICTLPG